MHGWVNLYKPPFISSTQALGKVKKLFQQKKAGHAGTLDPLAQGILPLAFGQATRLIPFCVDHLKTYEFTATWGACTQTDDQEGDIIQTSEYRPSLQEIINILPRFTGSILQTPPLFSAIKVNGKRAYALARDKCDFTLQSRQVVIENLSINQSCDTNLKAKQYKTDFKVTCQKGVYIRSLARDIGAQLGCLGHVSALKRTTVGVFTEKNAISLDSLEKIVHTMDDSYSCFLPMEIVLDDILALFLSSPEADRIKNGQKIEVKDSRFQQDQIIKLYQDNYFIGIGKMMNPTTCQPFKIFNI